MSKSNEVPQASQAIADKYDADVIVFNGHTYRDYSEPFLDMVHSRKRRENVILVLITPGGTADAAFRMARCLQTSYKKFTVLVPGWCKSAGTLCVLGAHEVVMTDCAELGPLDVQMAKKDELGEMNSGLVLAEAMRAMKAQAFQMYEEYMLKIKESSEGLVSFKMASEIATEMAVGLHGPIYQQLAPIHIGETFRSMRIARSYGARLQVESKNSRPKTLELLVDSYPDHGFVIDRKEAKRLFYLVREPNKEEAALVIALGKAIRYPPAKPQETTASYLNDQIKRKTHAATTIGKGRGAKVKRAARGENTRRDSGRAVEDRRVAPEEPRKEGIRLIPKASR